MTTTTKAMPRVRSRVDTADLLVIVGKLQNVRIKRTTRPRMALLPNHLFVKVVIEIIVLFFDRLFNRSYFFGDACFLFSEEASI
jgi:hypothetical protein